MALQGDLSSFALPDVLRLLAGTGKSGRLVVEGGPGGGQVLLGEGAIVAGAVTAAPHAIDAADVIFELLRLEDGSFRFEEGPQDIGSEVTDVEEAIAAAEALVREWAEVETVVPSMHAWISLSPEAPGEDVHLTADQWRAVAAVGGGGNARDLAVALELTDLATCRRVMELAEAELVTIRPTHGYTSPDAGYAAPEVELDSFDRFEVAEEPPMTELEDLVVEDRPVVMEEREDALLPEPLPGEGVAFEGDGFESEAFTGSVDGRSIPMLDIEPPAMPAEVEPLESEPIDAAPEDLGPAEAFGELPPPPLADASEQEPEDELEEALVGPADADPFAHDVDGDEYDSATSADQPSGFEAEVEAHLAALAEAGEPADAETADEPHDEHDDLDGDEVDEERDSLLKFLSSVKH